MKTRLTRVGDRVMLVLDPSMLEQLGWAEDEEVEVSVKSGRLVVTAVRDLPHDQTDS